MQSFLPVLNLWIVSIIVIFHINLNFGGEKPSFGKYFDIFLRFPKTGRQKEVIS